MARIFSQELETQRTGNGSFWAHKAARRLALSSCLAARRFPGVNIVFVENREIVFKLPTLHFRCMVPVRRLLIPPRSSRS